MNLLLRKAKSAYTEQQRESSFLKNEENSIFCISTQINEPEIIDAKPLSCRNHHKLVNGRRIKLNRVITIPFLVYFLIELYRMGDYYLSGYKR